MTDKTSVRVRIVGEEFTLRSDAGVEHTRAVAAHVSAVIAEVSASGTVIESQKLAILAALQIADELLHLRAEESARSARLRALAEEATRWLPPAKRALDVAG